MAACYQVRLAYATAGVVVEDGLVVEAAPIFEWAVGRRFGDLLRFVERRKGVIDKVTCLEGSREAC